MNDIPRADVIRTESSSMSLSHSYAMMSKTMSHRKKKTIPRPFDRTMTAREEVGSTREGHRMFVKSDADERRLRSQFMLEAELRLAQRDKRWFQNALNETKSRLKEREKEYAELLEEQRKTNEAHESDLRAAREQIAGLKEETKKIEREKKKVLGMVRHGVEEAENAIQQERKRFEKRTKEFEGKIAEEKKLRKLAETEVKILKTSLLNARENDTNAASIRNENEEMKSAIGRLTKQLRVAEDATRAANLREEEKDTKIRELTETCADLRKQLKESVEKIEQARSNVQTLKATFEKKVRDNVTRRDTLSVASREKSPTLRSSQTPARRLTTTPPSDKSANIVVAHDVSRTSNVVSTSTNNKSNYRDVLDTLYSLDSNASQTVSSTQNEATKNVDLRHHVKSSGTKGKSDVRPQRTGDARSSGVVLDDLNKKLNMLQERNQAAPSERRHLDTTEHLMPPDSSNVEEETKEISRESTTRRHVIFSPEDMGRMNAYEIRNLERNVPRKDMRHDLPRYMRPTGADRARHSSRSVSSTPLVVAGGRWESNLRGEPRKRRQVAPRNETKAPLRGHHARAPVQNRRAEHPAVRGQDQKRTIRPTKMNRPDPQKQALQRLKQRRLQNRRKRPSSEDRPKMSKNEMIRLRRMKEKERHAKERRRLMKSQIKRKSNEDMKRQVQSEMKILLDKTRAKSGEEKENTRQAANQDRDVRRHVGKHLSYETPRARWATSLHAEDDPSRRSKKPSSDVSKLVDETMASSRRVQTLLRRREELKQIQMRYSSRRPTRRREEGVY